MKLEQRIPSTRIEVFLPPNKQGLDIKLFKPEEVAYFSTDEGVLRVRLTDGSTVTFGPAWFWIIYEVNE